MRMHGSRNSKEGFVKTCEALGTPILVYEVQNNTSHKRKSSYSGMMIVLIIYLVDN